MSSQTKSLPLALMRLDRRQLMSGTLGYAALSTLSGCGPMSEIAAAATRAPQVRSSSRDRVTVPDGYRSAVVLRWGDPIIAGAEPLDASAVSAGALLSDGAAEQQAGQFGYNCDGLGVFELGDGRYVLCVNHEYPLPALMFPGWDTARQADALSRFVRQYPACVRYMQASVGISVVELHRGADWNLVRDSRLNRRITANTPIVFSGPARRHPLLGGTTRSDATCLGTLGNCAAGTTPWRTYLTAEENVDDFFGNGDQADFSSDVARAHERFGYRRRNSRLRWEYEDPRFDLAKNPLESLKFGWITEVDPFDAQRPIKKRTALGRFKHEGATVTRTNDGHAAVYMGDDQTFECFYKFVSNAQIDPTDRRANVDILDSGTLYVAKFHGDGSGEWLPLVFREHGPLSAQTGFESQADVLIRCREAADRLGATPLDRPEDVAVDERTSRVYLSCTQNLDRGSERTRFAGREVNNAVDAANPRPRNRFGHILEIVEDDDDAAARAFRWEVFVLAGTPRVENMLTRLASPIPRALNAESTYYAGFANPSELSAFANPDNMTFDSNGNLWIVTDGRQPAAHNNGCFVCPTDGESRGQLVQFMSGPVGAEISGCEITSDDATLFLTVQHPGEGGTIERPRSTWPDGYGMLPRPSLIAIEPIENGARLGRWSG